MANEEQLKILRQGVQAWNQWRKIYYKEKPDLKGANLRGMNLRGANFTYTKLLGAMLWNVQLSNANLSYAILDNSSLNQSNLKNASLNNASLVGADLSHTDLSYAILDEANLHQANLDSANLKYVTFEKAILTEANLYRSILNYTTFASTILINTNFEYAHIGWARFINTDLSQAKGLDSLNHLGPSTVGLDTLYKSGGKIPDEFLSRCGIPDEFITYLPSLLSAKPAIQFYSCFISYNHKDEEFAMRLYSRMRDAHIRVWFAPEDVKGGEKLHEQIESAIQYHDKLLIVLSDSSLQSEWVMTEIRKARKAERINKRRKLFPIRLVSMETIKEWECFDADSGKDLAIEVREYYIPDFSDWKQHDAFESAFERLLRDLRAGEAKPSRV